MKFFEGMNFKGDEGSREKREFKPEELSSIYSALLKQKEGLKSHEFWVTMIVMFTGARLNEITQLHFDDIKINDGISVFDITDEGYQHKIKNKHSRRYIPIHKKLMELGLMDYINQHKSKRIFPELPYCGNNKSHGKNVSRWFNNTFLSNLGIKSKSVDYQSFRNSMSTELYRENIEEGKISSILGHKRMGMTQRYNTGGYSIKQLKEAIEMFKFNYSDKG